MREGFSNLVKRKRKRKIEINVDMGGYSMCRAKILASPILACVARKLFISDRRTIAHSISLAKPFQNPHPLSSLTINWFIHSHVLSLFLPLIMSKSLKLIKDNASSPKLWLAIGIGVAGIVVLAETRRRRRRLKTEKADFGAFVLHFELPPSPQPPPPAPKHMLDGLKFAVKDMFVPGFSFLPLKKVDFFFCLEERLRGRLWFAIIVLGMLRFWFSWWLCKLFCGGLADLMWRATWRGLGIRTGREHTRRRRRLRWWWLPC